MWRDRVKRCFSDPLARQSFWRDTCLAVEREGRFEQEENEQWLEVRMEKWEKR